MIVGKLQFRLRAQHAVRLDAADHSCTERDLLARNEGARRREDGAHAGSCVGSPAHDLDRRAALSGIDHADPQPIRIGVRPGLDHPGDGETREAWRRVFHALHLKADAGESLDDLGQRRFGFEVILEPGQREFHERVPESIERNSALL